MALTHDELLAEINLRFQEIPVDYGQIAAHKALRAVVELHKPKGNFADTYVNGEPNSPYCPECIDPDVYPCSTIQQIIENLK